jgi:hypothetical protein
MLSFFISSHFQCGWQINVKKMLHFLWDADGWNGASERQDNSFSRRKMKLVAIQPVRVVRANAQF